MADSSEDRAGRMTRRQEISAFVERKLLNPIVRRLLLLGIAPRAFALLETVGRRSGRPRLTPVGNGMEDHVFWLVAEHGTRTHYVRNLLANPRVRIKVGRRWRQGSATLVPGEDGRRRRRQLDRANGIIGWLDGLAFRAAATDPCTIRIDLTDD
jgi:deazaflavin-dependent oxidoreductase (nitroreductase family)